MKLCLPHDLEQIDKLLMLFKANFNTKSKAIFRKNLLLNYKLGYPDRTLRRYIQYIRQNDLCGCGFLLSNVKIGYWYTEDEDEMNQFINQELNRMASQYESVEKLHIRLRTTKKSKKQLVQISIFN